MAVARSSKPGSLTPIVLSCCSTGALGAWPVRQRGRLRGRRLGRDRQVPVVTWRCSRPDLVPVLHENRLDYPRRRGEPVRAFLECELVFAVRADDRVRVDPGAVLPVPALGPVEEPHPFSESLGVDLEAGLGRASMPGG
jgi:hypothetical protein